MNSASFFNTGTLHGGHRESIDNVARFYKWFAENEEEVDVRLSYLTYGVFKFRNRSYKHFNKVTKRIDTTLERHGVKCIVEVSLGDNDESIEDDFTVWKGKLWPKLHLLLKDQEELPRV